MLSVYNKKTALITIGAVFFVVLDRFLKSLAISGVNFDLIGSFFRFDFAGNYNIAFSLPLSGQVLLWFVIFIIICLLCNFIYLYEKKDYISSAFLFLIILGSSSNLLDRLKYDFVIDYLNLKYFTVFNLADALIVFGVFLLIFSHKKRNK